MEAVVYDSSVGQCDVHDKGNLKKFREKRQEWLNWLTGDDSNSVWNQIRAMEWNHRVFLMINESRKIASRHKTSATALNPLLSEFVDQGYVAHQALAIRKQLEKKNNSAKKQIVSLRRTLDDIHENRPIINRECYVCYDGLPFDYEPVKQASFKHRAEQHQAQLRDRTEETFVAGWLPTTGLKAWKSSERRHEAFDGLTNANQGARSRPDTINSNVLDFFVRIIDRGQEPFKGVIEFSNKYVAHAADGTSIATLAADQHGISIDKVEECQKRLWQVAQYIISRVLYDTYIVPGITYQGNPLKHLDQPWLPMDQLEELQQFWNAEDQSRNDWPDEFSRELKSALKR